MSTIHDDVKAAKELGISYGQYKALTWDRNAPPPQPPAPPKKPSRKKKRKFQDTDAFDLWQKGYSDSQIGAALGVSRAIIQRWRDTLELPSTADPNTDTKKYRLVFTQDGIFALYENDE